MRPTPLMLMLALYALSACAAPTPTYRRAGSEAQFDRDNASCRVEAIRTLPPAFLAAPASVNVTVAPRAQGYLGAPPPVADTPRDMNRGARQALYQACLEERGHTKLSR